MRYIVYDTRNLTSFFSDVMKFFFNTLTKKNQSVASGITIQGLTSIFIKYSKKTEKYKYFLCQGYNKTCNCEKVILSNLQLKFFIKYQDEYYNTISQIYENIASRRNFWAGLFAQQEKIKRNTIPDYDYINVVDDEGKITRCEPAMVRIRNLFPNGLPPYLHITDNQSDQIFFDGIALSLNRNDYVKFITPDHTPAVISPVFTAFDGRCVHQNSQVNRNCCSIHTNPNCKLLQSV